MNAQDRADYTMTALIVLIFAALGVLIIYAVVHKPPRCQSALAQQFQCDPQQEGGLLRQVAALPEAAGAALSAVVCKVYNPQRLRGT